MDWIKRDVKLGVSRELGQNVEELWDGVRRAYEYAQNALCNILKEFTKYFLNKMNVILP